MAQEIPLETGSKEDDESKEWLEKAKQAWETSTSYVDNNYRKKWEDALRHQQSKHHQGSKYNTSQYRYRSKVFRSKTRSKTRNNEAAAVAAFFSNQDIVSVDPQTENDDFQKGSAAIIKSLLQYRLTKTIPWFLLCIGGFQDSMVSGVVCSKQTWKYEEDDEGNVVKDEPHVALRPIENVRFHPAASWEDPIESSPYAIDMIPMYIADIKKRMETPNKKTGAMKWKKLTDDEISSAVRYRYDSTRQTREDDHEDKFDNKHTQVLKDYDTAWVHENIMRQGNRDLIYYTLGTQFILSDPVPLEEVYFTDERPFALGFCVIETHKSMPDSLVTIGSHLQKELNEVTNQRLDNVKLVLNKRHIVMRGRQVDVKSLTRNVPGSITFAQDPDKDIKTMEFNDVTGSSFQEQNLLSLEFDELMGNFSTSSVQGNRKLNETVGGMRMLQGAANMLVEYDLKVFAETWVKKVMRQLIKLEQAYETDEVVLGIAAENANLFQKYNVDEVTDELLNQELTLNVNVGMGATDPIMRVKNFMMGVDTVLGVIQKDEMGIMDINEVGKEVFGRMGYDDGTRFFMKKDGEKADPEKLKMQAMMQEMQQAIQQLQQALMDKSQERQLKLVTAEMKEDGLDRRKVADVDSNILMKQMDLENPVVGETIG